MDGRRRRMKWARHGNSARVRREPRQMQHLHSAKTISAKIDATTQAQTDDKQCPAGQIKRAFGKNAKKCKNRITNTLLVALGFPKSIENIGASAQVVSFLAIFKIAQVDISDPLTCQRMRRKRWRWRRRRRRTLTLNP